MSANQRIVNNVFLMDKDPQHRESFNKIKSKQLSKRTFV